MVTIAVGQGLFGTVDRIEGVGHVATECVHFCGMPIWPKRSLLVLTAPGYVGQAIPIRFSDKSYWTEWARGTTFTVGCCTGGLALIASVRPIGPVYVTYLLAAVAVVTWALFFLVTFGRSFRHASYERARALAIEAGLSSDVLDHIDLLHGRAVARPVPVEVPMTPEDVRREFVAFANARGANVRIVDGRIVSNDPNDGR